MWNLRPLQAGFPPPLPFAAVNSGGDFRHPRPLPAFENPHQPIFQRPFFDSPGHFNPDDRFVGRPEFHPGAPPAMLGLEHLPGPMGFVRPEFDTKANPMQAGGHFPEQRRLGNFHPRDGISYPSSWNSFPSPNPNRRSEQFSNLNGGYGNKADFGGISGLSVDRGNEQMQMAHDGFDNCVDYTGSSDYLTYTGTFGDHRGVSVVRRGLEEQRSVENGTIHKRPKLENGLMIDHSDCGHPSLANSGKRSIEDERISNLIRDHGGYNGPVGRTRFPEQPTSHYPLNGSFDSMPFQGRPHLPEGGWNLWEGADQLRDSSMDGARYGSDMEQRRHFGSEYRVKLLSELGSSVQHGVALSQPNIGSGNYGSHAAAGNPLSHDHSERGMMHSQDQYHWASSSQVNDKLVSGVYARDHENHFSSEQILPQILTQHAHMQMRADSSGNNPYSSGFVNQRILDHTGQNQDIAINHQEQGNSNKQDHVSLAPSKQGPSAVDHQMAQYTSDHASYGPSRMHLASKNQLLPLPDNAFYIRHLSQQSGEGQANDQTMETGKQQHLQQLVGIPNELHGRQHRSQDIAIPSESSQRNFGQSKSRQENCLFPELGPVSHLWNDQQMSQPQSAALPLAGEPPAPPPPPPPYPSSHQNQVIPPTLLALNYPGLSSTALPSSVGIPGRDLPEVQPAAKGCHLNLPTVGSSREEFLETQSKHSAENAQPFSLKKSPVDKLKVIDAIHLFMQPHRATRPDHIVIILRGLPGSGKSYLAKALRDLEVSNGGSAPRIHSMDDYFMTEVEKVEENESSKSSGSVKGKRMMTKKVIEYCYEPELEEAYRASMLKAFKKTLEDGIFKFVIVDDRNLRVADFAQFWATAKRSGYEVYILEATYRDIVGCAARNVHGFSAEDIQTMADKWEPAPPLYLQLDSQSLFHGYDLNDQGIAEVEMDMGEVDCSAEDSLQENDVKSLKNPDFPSPDYEYQSDQSGIGQRWQVEISYSHPEVKEIQKSKWSDNTNEVAYVAKPPKNASQTALSGLMHAYGKGDKSVHWGDHDGRSGFAIGVGKKSNSLIIGPGAGYNLDSNPIPEEEAASESGQSSSRESSRRTIFLEHLRAEHESFRAVFDRRRQRIGGFDLEDD